MRQFASCLLGLVIVCNVGFAVGQVEVSVQTMPPVVVATFPRAGDTKVDPATTEIRVTFSKDMTTDNMWSWVIHSKDSFPEIAGDVRYLEDQRTNVAPVKLYPGRKYAIWFNSPNYTYSAFRDQAGIPAIPYLLVFETSR